MSCQILIADVKALGFGQTLTSLLVSGSAQDCGLLSSGVLEPDTGVISVTISCDGASITKEANLLFTVWTVVFGQADNLASTLCTCGDALRVSVKCLGKKQGVPPQLICETEQTFAITCGNECTVETFPDVKTCSDPPNSHVKYKAIVFSPFPGNVTASLYVDNNFVETQSSPFDQVEVNFDGILPPAPGPQGHVFLVHVDEPNECKTTHKEHIEVKPCEPIGACCLPKKAGTPAVCEEMTEAECIAVGGTFKGPGIKCVNVTCGDGDDNNGGGNNGGRRGEPSPCGSFMYVVGALTGLTLAVGLAIVTLYCMGIPVPPAVWAFMVAFAAVTALVIALWYALCAWGICACPNKCDWLGIAFMSTLGAAAVALYLGGCCPPLLALGAVLFAGAVASLGSWIKLCKPSACAVWGSIGVALISVTAPTIAFIALYPVILACGVTAVALVVAVLGAIVAVALASCAAP